VVSYREGDYNVICELSGFKAKRSQCRKTWDGYLVRRDFWEPRHPQDRVTAIPERQGVKDARPEAADRFLTAGEVTPDDL